MCIRDRSFPVVYSHDPTTACQDGSYSAFVTIGTNPSLVKRTVAFALVARNGYSSFTGRFYVSLGARSVPEVVSVHATPSALPAGGGQVRVTGTVKHARSCQLELLSVSYTHLNSRWANLGRTSQLGTDKNERRDGYDDHEVDVYMVAPRLR